jgi:hypothetical protein
MNKISVRKDLKERLDRANAKISAVENILGINLDVVVAATSPTDLIDLVHDILITANEMVANEAKKMTLEKENFEKQLNERIEIASGVKRKIHAIHQVLDEDLLKNVDEAPSVEKKLCVEAPPEVTPAAHTQEKNTVVVRLTLESINK